MNTTQNLISRVGDMVDILIVIVAGLALLAFFWGLAKFIFRVGGDQKAVDEGKRLMIWGVLALFIMVSVWGIITFIQREFNLPTTNLDYQATQSEWDMPWCGPSGTISRTMMPCL